MDPGDHGRGNGGNAGDPADALSGARTAGDFVCLSAGRIQRISLPGAVSHGCSAARA